MKRRDFIKAGAATGSTLVLSSLTTGCSSDSEDKEKSVVKKSLITRLKHDKQLLPSELFNSLLSHEQEMINKYLPGFELVDKAHHKEEDELYVVNPGAKKLKVFEAPSKSALFKASSSNSDDVLEYESESTVDSEGYIVHMYYKKIVDGYESSDLMFENAYSSRGITQDKDDVISDKLPKYKLSYLVLIVPDGDKDETKVIDNPIRETVKTLLFRAPAFSSFAQDDLRYALSLFDTIFPSMTQLEMMINHAGMDNWFRYELHRDNEQNIVYRKTQTLDDDNNVIHDIGDAIYTYPIRDIFAESLKNDHKVLMDYLSLDERLSLILLPKSNTEDMSQSPRMAQWRNEFQKRAAKYNNHEYKVDSSALKAVGGHVEIDSVDEKGVRLSLSNHYKRHMAVSHLEINEQQQVYDWKRDKPEDDNYIQHNITLPPRYTLLGIPIGDAKANIVVPFRDGASATRIYFSSWSFIDGSNRTLYYGDNGKAVPVQAVKNVMKDPEFMTVVFDLALPTALIAWGGFNIGSGAKWRQLLAQYGVKFANDIASPIMSDANLSASEAMNAIVGPLVSHLVAGIGEIVAYILQEMAENEVEDSVPIAGQVYRAVCLLADISNLGQTIYALSVAKSIEYVDIKRYHTLKIAIRSDSNDHSFPDDLTDINVSVNYNNGSNATQHTFEWDSTKVEPHTQDGGGSYALYEIELKEQPSGGDVSVDITLNRDSWAAAHITKSISSYTNTATEIEIKNNLIKLSGASVYQHYAKLINDGNTYKWNVKEHSETLASPMLSDELLQENQLLKISVNDPIGAIGYSYRSLETNKYNVKNISAVLETANQGAKSYTSDEMVQVSYSLLSHKSNEGSVIFEKKDGVTYIRKIDINSESNDYEVDFSKNIGIFITDSVTQFGYYQPANIIVALDTESGVLHIINHLEDAIDDTNKDRYANVKSAPVSIKLSKDMDPTTQYFYNPKLLTMSPDGDIIVLEETLSGVIRLRAFDRNGYVHHDYQGFNNHSGVFELKKEDLSVTYLDISIESKGYIYILKRVGGDPTNIANYQLDIYNPKSTTPDKPMVTTNGVSGGKIVVDFWRRVYTLNYETNTLGEPTVSLWLPPV